MDTTRRSFISSSACSSMLSPLTALALQGGPQSPASRMEDRRVLFTGDGLGLTPAEIAALLGRLVEDPDFKPDSYLRGGVVASLEERFAAVLGKEHAVFFPTGTLANHLALRQLAGARRRVLVQSESHVYCDEGDGAQLLSGLNLIPLAPGHATVKAEDMAEAVRRSSEPPYPVPIGAISIESPVRRRNGEVFDFEEMRGISALAREKGIVRVWPGIEV